MSRRRTPFNRHWYSQRIDEYFKSDFLKGIGATVSDYLYASEQIELVRIESEAKKNFENWKKENTEPQLSKLEAFDYFRRLSVTNPLKYEKVLRMLGIDEGDNLHDIIFKKGDK